MPVHRHRHNAASSVYAYVAELDEWLVGRGDSGHSTTELSGAGRLPAPIPGKEQASIAVLPFDLVSADAADSHIADGFTDEVIADLGKIESLRVISRTSSMQLKQTVLSIGDIARKLDVDYLLEGSVRCHGEAVRVGVRLLEPYRERQVWSEKYSADFATVLEVQEQIARDVVSAMQLQLTDADESRLARRGTENWSARLVAVQARQASLSWTRSGIEQSVRLLTQALEAEGDVAELFVELGKAHLHLREAGFATGDDTLAEAQRCVDKAVALDPEGAGGLELRGWLHYSRGEIQQAVDDLKLAYQRQRSNPDTIGLLCNCYLLAGQSAVARMLIPQAMALDPFSAVYLALPAWADVIDGRHDRAVETYHAMLQREPESPLFRLFLVWILCINDRPDDAEAAAAGFADRDAGSLPAQAARCFAEACAGRSPTTDFSAEDRALASINDLYPRMIAQAYALAGDAERAVEWLTLAVARGFINYPYLTRHDPLLTRLNGTAAYDELMQTVRSRWESFVA